MARLPGQIPVIGIRILVFSLQIKFGRIKPRLGKLRVSCRAQIKF